MLLLIRGRRKVGVLGRSRVERSVFWAPQGSILWADEGSKITHVRTPPTYSYGVGRVVNNPGSSANNLRTFSVQHGATWCNVR